MSRPRLLIARAEPEASCTADLVTRLGGDPILAPMRRAISVESPAGSKPAAIVATSARAFHLGSPIPPEWHDMPCLVVGEVTGEAAREAGFRDIRIARGEAASLVPLLAEFSGNTYVYLAGEPRRPELETDAQSLGIQLVPWLRYRMEDVDTLPETARAALRDSNCDGILHFSRESVASLLRLVRKAGLSRALWHPVHACLSPAIAESLSNGPDMHHPSPRIVIAPARRAEALIEAALQACQGNIRP